MATYRKPDDALVDAVIDARMARVATFELRRLLPHAMQRSVGPFVFVDHFGPVTVPADVDSDVRAHPHIGLATVTWLWEGRTHHRDSIGGDQIIEPGELNLMTAGRGIVHSERTPEGERGTERRSHGLQLWMALPKALEQCEPSFAHHASADLPKVRLPGAEAVVLMGEAWNARSKVEFPAESLYVDLRLEPGAEVPVPDAEERCVYVVEGNVIVGETALHQGQLAVLVSSAVSVRCAAAAHVVVLGGEPLDGPRTMHWNYVASDRALIDRAVQRWRDGAFGGIPGDPD